MFMKASQKMLGVRRTSSPFLDLLESGGAVGQPAQLQLHLTRKPEWGQDLLLKFAEGCGETAVMDKAPKLEGRHMSIFLSPKPAKDMKK